MRYMVVRIHAESKMPFPIMNKEGDIVFYDSAFDANLERIYLQPNYEELLKVQPTTLSLK
jgi:hypothetical protein